MVKKRRKRKKRYKTGEHHSTKLLNGPAKYRSGWEAIYMVWLDNNPHVVSYEYESVRVSYISNYKTGKTRLYTPDFLVNWDDGHATLVEVKPTKKLDQLTIKRKAEAAKVWCSEHNAIYEFITEDTLKELGCKL